MTKSMYRIHLFKWTGNFDASKYRSYCLENNILALGWSPYEYGIENIANFKEYLTSASGEWKDSAFHTAINAIRNIQIGELCWTQIDGVYYLGKINDTEPHYEYNKYYPYIGPYRMCVWKKCHMDEVPGDIIRGLIGGKTLQRVGGEISRLYSEFIYDGSKSKINKGFADLLHPIDVEDLLGIYLQVEKGYILYPSTSKNDTAEYEFMLMQKDSKKRAVVQCKTGNTPITDNSVLLSKNFSDFDVYLTAIYGDYPKTNHPNIHIVKIEELDIFARNYREILPRRIQKFLEFTD